MVLLAQGTTGHSWGQEAGLGGPLRWPTGTFSWSYVPVFLWLHAHSASWKSPTLCKTSEQPYSQRQGKNMDRGQAIGQTLRYNTKLRTGSRQYVQGQKPGASAKPRSSMTAGKWCFLLTSVRKDKLQIRLTSQMTDHPSQQELIAAKGAVWWWHYLGKLVAVPTLPKLKAWSGKCGVPHLCIRVTMLEALYQWLKWPGPSAQPSLSKGIHCILTSLSCKQTVMTVEILPPSTSRFSKSREKCLRSLRSLFLLPSYFQDVFVYKFLELVFSHATDFSII